MRCARPPTRRSVYPGSRTICSSSPAPTRDRSRSGERSALPASSWPTPRCASRTEPVRWEGSSESRRRDLHVDADPLRAGQALVNLVDNALTHGQGTVVLRAEERAGLVELHVSDGGSGFPPEFRERAFDRFSRADEARSGGGSGLGLSIVELVAAAHGGEVGLSDTPSGGADVWISLPLGWHGGGSRRAPPAPPADCAAAVEPAVRARARVGVQQASRLSGRRPPSRGGIGGAMQPLDRDNAQFRRARRQCARQPCGSEPGTTSSGHGCACWGQRTGAQGAPRRRTEA